jgi:ketosteroid isomerase-like protein
MGRWVLAHVELPSMHPNERLLRQEYEARATRDDTSLADLFEDDIVWHVPGRSTISGDYRGKEQVMEYVRLRRELAAGTFEIDVQDVLANDQYGLVIARGTAAGRARYGSGERTGYIASGTAASRSVGRFQRTNTCSMKFGADEQTACPTS